MVVVAVLMYEFIDALPIHVHHNTKLQKLQLGLEVAASVLVCIINTLICHNSYDIYLQKSKYYDGILNDCDKKSFFEISKILIGLASARQYQNIQVKTIKNLQENALKAMVSVMCMPISSLTSLTFYIYSFIDRKMF